MGIFITAGAVSAGIASISALGIFALHRWLSAERVKLPHAPQDYGKGEAIKLPGLKNKPLFG
ncbi:MAG: hypothetical protein ACWA5X_09045 [bacterium]